MRLISIAIFVITILLSSIEAKSQMNGDSEFYLGGIQVNEPDHDKWVDTLREFGMNTVSVTVYAKQGDWDSDNLWFDETNKSVISEIRTAKSRGLNVILILRVALDHAFEKNQFLWHGMIMPETENELESWFQKYTKFAVKWAVIAERENVDVFTVGSEMNALTATIPVKELPNYFSYFSDELKQLEEKNEILQYAELIDNMELRNRGEGGFTSLNDYLAARNRANLDWSDRVSYAVSGQRIDEINRRRDVLNTYWIRLIRCIKLYYSGQLSYAANFDNYFEVGFWEHLDFIGINAYFPLRMEAVVSDNQDEVLPGLENAWEKVFEDINEFRGSYGLEHIPVIFTELGYTFRKYSTVHPWNSHGFSLVGSNGNRKLVIWRQEPIDFEERSLAIRALYNVSLEHEQLLRGILYWKFSTLKEHYDIEPFMIYLGTEFRDPLLDELRLFVK